MPRDGATTFSDLIGKLDVLRVTCDKCGRSGRYNVKRLIETRGGDAKLIDWVDEIAADCPKRTSVNCDQCRARCPDLPRVLTAALSLRLSLPINARADSVGVMPRSFAKTLSSNDTLYSM